MKAPRVADEAQTPPDTPRNVSSPWWISIVVEFAFAVQLIYAPFAIKDPPPNLKYNETSALWELQPSNANQFLFAASFTTAWVFLGLCVSTWQLWVMHRRAKPMNVLLLGGLANSMYGTSLLMLIMLVENDLVTYWAVVVGIGLSEVLEFNTWIGNGSGVRKVCREEPSRWRRYLFYFLTAYAPCLLLGMTLRWIYYSIARPEFIVN